MRGLVEGIRKQRLEERIGGAQADCDRRHRCQQFAMIQLIDQTANQGERVISPAATWYVWLVTIDLMLEAMESVRNMKGKRMEEAELFGIVNPESGRKADFCVIKKLVRF